MYLLQINSQRFVRDVNTLPRWIHREVNHPCNPAGAAGNCGADLLPGKRASRFVGL